jgi:hypothetical protein
VTQCIYEGSHEGTRSRSESFRNDRPVLSICRDKAEGEGESTANCPCDIFSHNLCLAHRTLSLYPFICNGKGTLDVPAVFDEFRQCVPAGPVDDGRNNVADLTLQNFSEGLGWLIVNSQAGGVPIEDQIMVMQSALDALRREFS